MDISTSVYVATNGHNAETIYRSRPSVCKISRACNYKNHAHPNNTIGAKHPVFLGKNLTIHNLKTPVSWITHAHRVILPVLRVASPINIADFPPTKNALALHEFLISRARSHQPPSTHVNMTGQSGWTGSKQSKAITESKFEVRSIASAV